MKKQKQKTSWVILISDKIDYFQDVNTAYWEKFTLKTAALHLYNIKIILWYIKWFGFIYQSCLTLCDPIDGSPPGSLGFSRQEHWSGVPFPSPMHESEKWKWSRSVVSNPQWPHGLQPSRLLHPWDFPGKSTGVGVPLPSPYQIIM